MTLKMFLKDPFLFVVFAGILTCFLLTGFGRLVLDPISDALNSIKFAISTALTFALGCCVYLIVISVNKYFEYKYE